MARRRTCAPFLLAALLAMGAVPAGAHEYWLAPSRYRAGAGDTVAVGAFAGTGFRGEAKPYAARRAVRFTLSAARDLSLATAAMNGEMTWASFVLPDDDGALIAYQSNFAAIELPAAEFDTYLRLEGLTGPREARQQSGAAGGAGRERYARCPKTWIAGARPGTGAARALRPAGLPLEVVPLGDPGRVTPLPVRVLWRGRPLAGALVRAWSSPLGPAWAPRDAAARDSVGPSLEARTDGRGEARLSLPAAGEWLIGTVHMVPCAERREADWESWWASLTFARGPRER